MLGMSHSGTDTQTIRAVAKAMLREIDAVGHICVHGEDFGSIKADLTTIKTELKDVRKDVKDLREEMVGVRTERKVAAAIIGFISACLGAVAGAFTGR